MDTVNYQSPNTFLFLHHQISVNDANKIIYDWLKKHPQESRASLSKLLEAEKVIVKHNRLYDLPTLSKNEAIELARELEASDELETKDRQYKLSKYERCFIGSELVDWLLKHREVVEAEAIAIGQSLLEQGLINHVLNQHDFKNEFLFYRFTEDIENLNHSPSHQSRLSLAEATELAQNLQSNPVLEIKDRRYRLTSYKQCFVGSELVDCLVKGNNITPKEATRIGQNLLEHNLIVHVRNEHNFKNEYLFYRFHNS